MAATWMRRTFAIAACASATLLAACGGSSTADSVTPTRIISFGDTVSDLGQGPSGSRYSVNNGSINNWIAEVADRYGISVAAANAGGAGYARGNARVSLADATGVTNAPSVTQQVDAYLAGGGFTSTDFVFIGGGQSDIVAGMNEYLAGTKTQEQFTADMVTAAEQLAGQVDRLVNAGAPHVLVSQSPNVGRSLWAAQLNNIYPTATTKPSDVLETAVTKFNQTVQLAVGKYSGTKVLFVDLQGFFNSISGELGGTPGSGFSKNTEPVCTSVDASNGLGIGLNQINSLLCNDSTLIPGATLSAYVFADPLNYTPEAHVVVGDRVYNRIKANW
ncbi:SGNH/GDSL hydrolase family protein [Comamonas humi]